MNASRMAIKYLLIGHAVHHHLRACVHVHDGADVNTHAKSIQQLWPQLALLHSAQVV